MSTPHTLPAVFVLVRHGNYGGPNEELNQTGYKQIGDLVGPIKDALSGSRIVVISSPVRRATQSARILATALTNGDMAQRSELETHYRCLSQEQYDAILDILTSQKDATPILVGHYELVNNFRKLLADAFTLPALYALSGDMEKGRAVIVDTTKKTAQFL